MSYVLLSESFPRAKKQYDCIWCGQKIEVGEKYCREGSVYDGRMQNHQWHIECSLDSQRYFKESGEEEFDPYENKRPMTAFDPTI